VCVSSVCVRVCARWTRSEKSGAVSYVLERAVSIGVQYESYMICQCSGRCSKKISILRFFYILFENLQKVKFFCFRSTEKYSYKNNKKTGEN
jgi:hypothetical protein